MTTGLIAAPPAAGKTAACIQRIRSVRAASGLAAIRVVVPDRLQAAAFRSRLAQAGGALGVSVGTFGDLYRHILEQAQVDVPAASAPLLHRLVQETVDGAFEAGELIHFAPLQHMPGFIQALRQAFAELKRALVYPEQFLEFARPGPLARGELALLYARYQALLQQLNWADPEGISWLAVAALQRQPEAAASIRLLVVDGFDLFTGVQAQALKLLAPAAGQLLVTFPGQPGSHRPAQRRFVEGLERLVAELEPGLIRLDAAPHLPAALLHLESQLYEAESRAQPVDLPFLLEARSPADEAREALRWIKALVVRQGVPLPACAIFTPNPAIYHPLLRAAAREYGMPIRFTQAEALVGSPPVAALLNLLTLPATNFNTRLLIKLLRSPYFALEIEPQTADLLETISRAAQIVEGIEQWQETWERLSAGPAPLEPELEEEHSLPGLPRGPQAAALRQSLNALFERLAPPSGAQPLTAWVGWLEDLLDDLQFYQKASSPPERAACEGLRQLLRALVLSEDAAGERRLEYAGFLSDLQSTLEGAGLDEPIIAGQQALLVGLMAEARGLRFQAVALLGLSEGLFPANEHPDPFLDEDLRSALGLEARLERQQAGLFYQLVTRSDQHLLITRPYLSEDGERWEESTFWKAVQRLFEPGAVQTVRPDDPRPLAEAASTQELLFAAVRRQGLPLRYEFLAERWHQLRHAGQVLNARRAHLASGPYEGYAEPLAALLGQRYAQSQAWSASRLEAYGSCPFQFYIGSALGLEGRPQPQLGLDASQLGSMLHKILEDAYRLAANPASLEAVLASLGTAAEAVFATAPRVYGFRPSALWEHDKAGLLEKLEKSVQALAEDASWMPFAYEAKFGLDGAPPLVISLENGETLQVRGVIDRVDRNAAGELRVVDYKTGGSHLTSADLKSGRRLQLPIYALAARDVLNLGNPVDGIYWRILGAEASSLKLAKFNSEEGRGVAGAIQVTRQHLERIVGGIRAAEFPPQAPRGGCPAYCPAAQWCWRFEAEW